jgi:hypothetical protein
LKVPEAHSNANFATPSQMLLLRAALGDLQEAATAAHEWFRSDEAAGAGRRFERLESGSHRLLPLVYHNVKESLPSDLRNRLKEVHLEYWASNQKLFRDLESALIWFQANNIPTLVLKGAAVSLLHYQNSGLRPTCDADVLIPEEQASEIVKKLLRGGWSCEHLSSGLRHNSYVYRHIPALPFTSSEFGSLDLHWYVLHAAPFPGADRPFWKDSVPLRVKSAETRALNPSDQLLHACLHGFARNLVAPIRWIADAATVLRTSSVDWNRILNLARELRVTLPLRLTLSFLKERFQADVPRDFLDQLSNSGITGEDRRYFDAVDALATVEKHWSRIARFHYEKQRRIRLKAHPLLRLAYLPRDFGAFAIYRLSTRMNSRLFR